MLWLWVVITSQVFNAGAMLLDKFLLTKKFPRPAVLTFWTALANLLGVVFVFFDFHFYPGNRLLILSLLSGAAFTIALWLYYISMKRGEASHVGPIVGGVVPIVSFALSYFWLGERLNQYQMIAVGLLVLGVLLISFEKTRKQSGWHVGMLYAVIAGIFFAASYVIMRAVYLETTFSTGFVWARVGCFVAALPLLLNKNVRQEIFGKAEKKEPIGKSGFAILAVNKILSTLYFVGMNFAIYLVSATLVNAMAGLQYVFLFILIFISTKMLPKFFKEYFTRLELILEIVALILIVAGLGVMVIS